MKTFVDTSALYAVLDEDDLHFPEAATIWRRLASVGELITHAYVVVEATALIQGHLGPNAAKRLHDALLPVVDVRMIDHDTHRRAVARWAGRNRSGLSLVDVTSFVMMEDTGVRRAFAFDPDFAAAGFQLEDPGAT